MKQEISALRRYGSIAIVQDEVPLKPLYWMGSSHAELNRLPKQVKREVGYALCLAQPGQMHAASKPLKGFDGAGVLEVVSNFAGNAFRSVYTVRYLSAVYMLRAFQKKSKRGLQTPRLNLTLIRERLKQAERHHAQQADQ